MYAWRGLVGLVKLTYRAGSLERFIRLMPDGEGVIPRYVGIRAGSEKEFQQAWRRLSLSPGCRVGLSSRD